MFGTFGEAAKLVVNLALGNTTLRNIGEKFDIGKLIKVVMNKVSKLDFEDLKNNLSQVISDATAPVRSVPKVKEIPGIKDMYLSKTITEELRKNLDTNKELMENVPDRYLSEYKEESLNLIGSLSDKLKEYEKCFDILIQGKSSSFLRRKNSVDYNKIWGVRKTMKRLLHEMNLLLKGYKEGNTFKEIEEKFGKENEKTHEKAKSALERLIFAAAYKSVYKEALPLIGKSISGSGGGEKVVQTMTDALTELRNNCKENAALRASCGESLALTNGVTFEVSGKGDFLFPDFDEVKDKPGPKLCSLTAEEHLRSRYENKTPFEVRGLKAEPPFMGDYTEKILVCVKKTQGELNDVINLGSKKSKEPPQQSGESKTFEKDVSSLDIDLKTLLGDQYKNYVKNFEKQKEVLKTAVNKNLINQMYTLHSQVEKEYKKINQYREKYFLGSKAKDAPGEKEKFYDFSQLKVNVTSTKTGDDKTGDDKNYEIASKHDELQKIYGEALRNSTSVNHVSLYIRKAKKFLEACKVWNKERSNYEKWLSDRKTIAKEWLRRTKEHFQYLKSQIKSQKNVGNKLVNLKKLYGELPWFAYTFVKDFKTNVEKAEKFCKLKIKEDGNLVDSEGKLLSG